MGENKTKNNKIKKGVTISVVVAAFILLAIFLVCTFTLLASAVESHILQANEQSIRELALHDSQCIKNSVKLRWDNMQCVADLIENCQCQSESEAISAMQNLLPGISSATELSIIDEDGVEYNSIGTIKENEQLNEVCAKYNDNFVLRMQVNAYFVEDSREVLYFGIPVNFKAFDKNIKWLICKFPITALESELKIDSYDGKGVSTVVDGDGNYIVYLSRTTSFEVYSNFLLDIEDAVFEQYDNVNKLKEAADNTDGTVSTMYNQNGTEKMMAVTSLDFADWYLVTTVPTSVFSDQSGAIMQLFWFILGGIGVVIFVLLAIYFVRRREREKLQIAESASKSKTEFLFNMSHDIRTPMNAILGYTDMCIRHIDNREKTEENLKKIKVAGGHLIGLINDILEMSRIEAGKIELTEAPLDIFESIDGIEQMCYALASQKEIDFTVNSSGITNNYVLTDELHINEVIINLVSNAIKYTQSGGKVSLSVFQNGEPKDGIATYILEVEDTGIGMSQSFMEHLFEVFSREENTTVSKQEGTGLGLSIVKRIIDLAGGKIDVSSVQGKGSIFTVTLPVKVMTDEEIVAYKNKLAENAITDRSIFKGKKVLLVEDNEMNRDIATEMLTDEGIEMVIEDAENGKVALEKVIEKGVEYYDLILMDIQMPVMNGYESTVAIRKLENADSLPIIALSANAFAEDREASKKSGMNAHVAKPINLEELLSVMAKYLKK